MKPKITTAFILAAGFGTRLMPLTENLPKALVSYKGKPMIENVISKLKSFGITDFYINTHHHADKMEEYFSERKGDEQITLIHEKEILGTGGAIKNAAKLLPQHGNFIIYNTDVDSDAEMNELMAFHINKNSLVTLCVQNRETKRYLLFNEDGRLVGKAENGSDKIYIEDIGAARKIVKKNFCGIHAVNSRLFSYLESESDSFDVISFYMKMINIGEKIYSIDISEKFWIDLGTPENL
jgi:MurNAc alpha-1-phosphate uridylyltransferase